MKMIFRNKHFFLQDVFIDKIRLVKDIGFKEIGNGFWYLGCYNIDNGSLHNTSDAEVESFLLTNSVAGQIFVAKMWGAGNE